MKIRLLLLATAIGLMFLLIAATARSSWIRIKALQAKLSAIQLESFRIADHFQRSLLELNNILFRYEGGHLQRDWQRFEKLSLELDRWIDQQRPSLSTDQEKALLDQINQTYDHYIDAARAIQKTAAPPEREPAPEVAAFEREAEQLLNLGYRLADAHRASLNAFLAETSHSLDKMRAVLLTALGLLLLLGCILAWMVYRDMIAPMQVRLVQTQAQAERNEKMASLGLLAAGVAHEVRNPLTAIKARLFTLQKLLNPASPARGDAEVIGSEINRLERIVKDFLLFARPSEPKLDPVKTDELLAEVCALLQPQLERSAIRLDLATSPAGPPVPLDRQQIKQVLINLVQNAADSIERNGQVTLRTRRLRKSLQQRPVDVVVLEVQDTGKGIPPEVEKRLFDPFFSTKEAGTGLGLSIAARIVEKHGGALQYQTSLGTGTTFGIVLPVSPDPRLVN